MVVITGLGNPGLKYHNTKHNIGFITVDLLAGRHGIKISKLKHKALIGEGMIGGKKVMLVKPQTYMNESGQSVRDIVHYYGVAPEDLIVVYDDVDLPVGSLRIRGKGSAGSHNGMKSIIYLLEDDGFPRFRVGIGADRGEEPLRSYVLTGFEKSQIDQMRDAVVRCAAAIETMLEDGLEAAMMKYNVKTDV
jgi:PTH1 family peptidyl-tRNA hydrolase